MPKTTTLKKSSRTNMLIALAIALGVTIVAYLLYSTFAAGPAISVEPEANIAANNKAKSIDDTTASGGKALQFGAVATTPTPDPDPEPGTPPPSGDPGRVLFDASFESGSFKPPFGFIHGNSSIVSSPVREGSKSAKLSGSSSQRAQLDEPYQITDGQERYVAFSTYFPSNSLNQSGNHALFFQLHGRPYSGSPPISLNFEGRDQIQLVTHERGSSGKKVHWSGPMVKDRWMDFTLLVRASKSSNGFIELWVNGDHKTLSNGSKRVVKNTLLDRAQLFPTLTAYMGGGSATVYHDALKVGTTYQSVQPKD